MISDVPITYRNTSVLSQLEYSCLHKTANMLVFLLTFMTIPIQKDDHSCTCTELSLKRKEEIGFDMQNVSGIATETRC